MLSTALRLCHNFAQVQVVWQSSLYHHQHPFSPVTGKTFVCTRHAEQNAHKLIQMTVQLRCNVVFQNLARPGLAVRLCIAMANIALTNPHICNYIRMTCAALAEHCRCASLTRHLGAEFEAAQRARV